MDFKNIIHNVRNKGGETSSRFPRLNKVAVVSGLFQSHSWVPGLLGRLVFVWFFFCARARYSGVCVHLFLLFFP